MAYFVAACKHKAFTAEQEVRYIAYSLDRPVKFRPGLRGIVPYVDCHFDRFMGEQHLSAASAVGVMCGPGNEIDQAEDMANVRRLLSANNYPETVTIEASEVPYRF